MTQEDKDYLIPQELYANAYVESWIDVLGEESKEFKLGRLCKDKESVPDYYEFSISHATHLGVVKLKIEKI